MSSLNGFRNAPHWLLALALAGVLAGVAGRMRPGTPGATAGSPLSAEAKAELEAQVRKNLLNMPLSFEQNQGQTAKQVDFVSRGPGYTLFLTPREAVLGLTKAAKPVKGALPGATPVRREAAVVRMQVLGGNPKAKASGVKPLEGKTNYLIGNDSKRWVKDVANFGKVHYAETYPGIDLVYYGKQQQLEYDFIVKPGADPDQIRLGFRGVDDLRIDETGDLVLGISGGEVRQHRPVIYQEVGGGRRSVEGSYTLRGKREVGFQVAHYDASKPLVIDPVLRYSTLVGGSVDDYGFDIAVDAGGNAYVTGYTGSYSRDENGGPAGINTVGAGYPTIQLLLPFPTINQFQNDPDRVFFNLDLDVQGGAETTFFATFYDAFVFKMNPTGNALVYSTYLGGFFNDDYGTAIAVDSAGSAYVTGMTRTVSFPILQPIQGQSGGSTDAFVTKLTPGGNGLVYSTYLGGGNDERGRSIAVDPNGNCAVTGFTNSPNLPVFRATQPSLGGGRDQFVGIINANGTAFNYLTYLGGPGNEGGLGPDHGFGPYTTIVPAVIVDADPDRPFGGATLFTGSQRFGPDFGGGVTIDALGNVYVVGTTTALAAAFPVSANALQPANSGGEDAFVIKYTPFGQPSYFTFLGGTGNDGARDVAIDPDGNAYVTGYTDSANFPVTPGAFRTANAVPGQRDAFVTKLNSGGSGLVYSTYLGGNGDDIGFGIVINRSRFAYVTGYTQSTDFPIVDPVQGAFLGTQDAFITKLNAAGTAVEYSSYLGGNFLDYGMSVAVDPTGGAFMTGFTFEPLNTLRVSTFPTTVGSSKTLPDFPTVGGLPRGGYGFYPLIEAFVSRVANPPVAPSNLRVIGVGFNSADIAWDDNADNETGFEIERSTDGANFSRIATTPANTLTYKDDAPPLIPTTTYFYRVRAVNADGASAYSNQASITTLPEPPAAPTGLALTVLDQTRIKLDWADASNNESGFRIERSLDGTNFTPLVTTGANANTFTDTLLTPNTTYHYRIRSFNAAGDSANNGPVSAKTLPGRPTMAPVLTATTVGSQQIDLSWTYTATDASGFKIERSTDSGSNFTLLRVTTTPNVLTFSDTNLTPQTRYDYRVQAYNVSGDGPFSNVANATTFPPPPAAPSGLSAQTVSANRIDLTFTDNSTNETGFRIERTESGVPTPTIITIGAFPGTGVRTHQDLTVVADRSYSYRVAALTGVSPSSFAGPATASTPPVAPGVPTARAVSSSSVVVSFTDNSLTETGFRLLRSANGGPFTALATPVIGPSAGTGGTVNATDTAVSQETTYAYQVQATNSGGSSASSASSPNVTVLAPPTGLTAQPGTQTSLNITFTDRSDFESGFKVERSLDGANFTELPPLGPSAGNGGTVVFTDTGLTANTAYTYRVRAFATNSDSNTTPDAQGTTLRNPPATPSNVRGTGLSQTQILVEWTDNADDEEGYRVERSTDGTNFTLLTLAPLAPVAGTGNTGSFLDSGLAADTTYTYRVFAFNNGGQGGAATGTGRTLPNPPGAPANLIAALIAPTTIRLTFTDTSPDETGFEVRRSANGGAFTTIITLPANAVTGEQVTHEDGNLALDTTYSYQVIALNAGGNSAPAGPASATTAPAAPSGLTLSSITSSQIGLFWINNSTTATGFRIERKVGNGIFLPLTTVPGTQTDFLDTGLTGSTQYTYRVRATNGGPIDSGFSNEAPGVTLPNPPAAPSGLTVTPVSSTQLDLRFQDNSNNETSFKIERSLDGTNWVQIDTRPALFGQGGTASYSATGLAPSTQYFFRVRASNAGGDSAFTPAASASTLPTPPAGPTGVTVAAVSDRELQVTFTDNATNETGFRVERSEAGGPFVLLPTTHPANPGTGPVSFVDGGLQPNREYAYRVLATNAGGNSTPSVAGTGLTFPATPANLAAADKGTGVLLTWTHTGGGDGFRIERRTGATGFVQIGTAGGSATSFTDSQALTGTQLFYRIRAFNRSGNSSYSNEASTTAQSGLVSVTLDASSVRGGRQTGGTVTLSAPAKAGGERVSLSSNNGKARVPSSVLVPAGATTARFTVRTRRTNRDVSATITGSLAGRTRTANLNVTRR